MTLSSSSFKTEYDPICIEHYLNGEKTFSKDEVAELQAIQDDCFAPGMCSELTTETINTTGRNFLVVRNARTKKNLLKAHHVPLDSQEQLKGILESPPGGMRLTKD